MTSVKHQMIRHLGRFSGIFSTLAAVGSASVGACTGGVCAVGVQAGASFFAASSATGVAGIAVASNGIPAWLQIVAHPGTPASQMLSPLSVWLKLAVILLLFSTIYTAVTLRDWPKLWILAGGGGVLAAVAEMRWLPGGTPLEYYAGGAGLLGLLLAPWLARWHGSARSRWALRLSLINCAGAALGIVFYLQFVRHWDPCLLCWVERGGLVLVIAGAAVRRNWIVGLGILTGGIATGAQLLEVAHSQAVSALATTCSESGPSCAVAGSQLWMGYPIIYAGALLWLCLWGLFLLLETR